MVAAVVPGVVRAAVLALVVVVAGLVLSAAFLWVEARRGDQAMMPVAMFADRCFSGLNLLTFLLYGAFGVAMLQSVSADAKLGLIARNVV